MKNVIVLLSLLVSFLAQAKPAFYEIKTETRFDVSNLFEGMTSVDYRHYGISDQVAHRYVLITTYRIPYGLEAQASFRYVPLERVCSMAIGGCQDRGNYTDGELTFRSPNMGIFYDLYDAESGKLLSQRSHSFEVTFYRRGHASLMTFAGGENGTKVMKGNYSPFVLADGTLLHVGAGIGRIKEAKFDLALGRSGSIYVIKDVWLHTEIVEQLLKTSGSVEVKQNGKKIQLSVGQAKATSSRLYEKYISNNY